MGHLLLDTIGFKKVLVLPRVLLNKNTDFFFKNAVKLSTRASANMADTKQNSCSRSNVLKALLHAVMCSKL